MKKHSKTLLGTSILFSSLFALTCAATYLLVPAKVTTVVENGDGQNGGGSTPGVQAPSHKDTLINNIVGKVMGRGLELSLDQAEVTFSGSGEKAINRLSLNGGRVALAISSLSLHGIDLSLDAPVNYNGKSRGLNVDLLDDNLYFSVTNLDDLDGSSYDLKYKVSTASYDLDLDQDGEPDIDESTGGILQYEYGQLDWAIDDILTILTDGDIEVPFPSISSAIGGSSSSSSSSSSLDTDAILSSMNDMEEGSLDGMPYFRWDLQIGELNLPLGLKADSSYNLVGIDLPYRNDQGTQNPLEIKEGIDVQVSATIAGGEQAIDWSLPYPETSYKSLVNSMGIFEGVAGLVANPQFGLDMDLTVERHEEAIPASETVIGKDEINEKVRLTLGAQIDMPKRSFNGVGAEFKVYVNDEAEPSQYLSANLLSDTEGKEAFVNLNNVLMAKTDKPTTDAIFAMIADSMSSTTDGQVMAKQSDAMSSAISAVASYLQGDLISGIQEGHYEAALDILKTLRNEDNFILAGLDLSPLGIDGEVNLTLDGNEGNSLLSIEFSNVKLSTFTLNGALKTASFSSPSLSEEEKGNYDNLTHLMGVVDQIGEIANSKSATLSLTGSLLDEDSLDVAGEPSGLSFSGKVGFDIAKGQAGMQINLLERNKDYRNTHTIKADLRNSDNVGETAYLSYSSANGDIDPENNPYNLTNPIDEDGINVKMPLSSFAPTIDSLLGLTKTDDRLTCLFNGLSGTTATGLLGSISSGHYFDLLKLHVIESASLEGDTNVFVLSGDSLGLDGKLTIKVNYLPNPEEGFESMTIEGNVLGKQLVVTLGLQKTSADEEDLSFVDSGASFTDLSSIGLLGSHLLDTITLGAANHQGVSTFALSAAVDLQLGKYSFNALKVEANVRVEGAKTQVYAHLDNLPIIKGINGPEDTHYFRPQEYEGSRDVAFYYYADGFNPSGEVLLTRDSSYGRIRNVKDSVRLSGAEFRADAASWILKYLIGVEESFFEGTAANAKAESASEAFHLEDILTSYEDLSKEGTPAIELGINLGNALGVSFLTEAKVGIKGVTALDSASNSFKAIEQLYASIGIALSGELKVCSANIAINLDNVKDGVYTDGFAAAKSLYESNFISGEGEDVSASLPGYNYPKGTRAGNLYL